MADQKSCKMTMAIDGGSVVRNIGIKSNMHRYSYSPVDEEQVVGKETKLKQKRQFLHFPKRYCITLLLFFETMMQAYLLTNTNIIVVALTSNENIEDLQENGTEVFKNEFNWTPSQRGVILSMDALGHSLSSFMGILINKMGGATCLGISIVIEGIISLAAPLMLNTHLYLFIANRLIAGFAEGMCLISCMDVFAHWIPLGERVQLVNYAIIGFAFGLATTYPASGFTILNFGWQYLFYIIGALLLIWAFIWIVYVSNDPSTDRFISEDERAYLARQMSHISKDKPKIPYRRIFTSVTVYALLNEYLIASFTTAFMLLLPLYVKDVYNADIQTVGLISGIPEFSAFIIRPLTAYFADYIRSKPNGASIGKIHKSFLFWGQSFCVIFFFIAAVSNHLVGCIICLTLARISYGFSEMSLNVLPIDVGGQYAAFLHSVVTFFTSITYFMNPIIVGMLILNHNQTEWNIYFLLVSFLTMYGVIVFVIFGSGDLQPWAEVPAKTKIANLNEDEAVRPEVSYD